MLFRRDCHAAFDPEFDTFQFMVWHKTYPPPKLRRAGFLNSCELIMCAWNKGHSIAEIETPCIKAAAKRFADVYRKKVVHLRPGLAQPFLHTPSPVGRTELPSVVMDGRNLALEGGS